MLNFISTRLTLEYVHMIYDMFVAELFTLLTAA